LLIEQDFVQELNQSLIGNVFKRSKKIQNYAMIL